MFIDLFGYRIYWTVPVAIILVFFILFILKKIISYRRESKAVYSLSVITDWQRENIPSILRKRISESQDEDNILRLCNYIENNTYWNDEEILEIDEDLVMDATFMLLNEVGELMCEDMGVKNKNRAILILVAIDFINGSLDLSSGRIEEWMDDALPGETGDDSSKYSEQRAINLYASTLERVADNYINHVIDAIPQITDAFLPLRGLTVDEFIDIFTETTELEDVYDINDKTANVIAYALYDQIAGLLERYQGKTVNNYYSSYIRALAVVLNKMTYPEIVSTIV